MNLNEIAVFSILALSIACTSQEEDRTKSFILKGEIESQASLPATITLRYWTGTLLNTDTTFIKNNKFIFKGRLTEPTPADIIGKGSNSARIYLEPITMRITLDGNNYDKFSLTGSKTQDEMNELRKMEIPLYERLTAFTEKRISIKNSILNTKNTADIARLEMQLISLNQDISEIKENVNAVHLKFIKEHPGSYLSPLYLNMLGSNEVILPDTLKAIYHSLDYEIQNSIQGTVIKDKIRKLDNIKVGQLAPDFKATDINQEIVTLKQFRNSKIVLLEFWASWCIPCREEIPILKDIYSKYHTKDFEIVAVSLDTDKEAWRSAISKDETDMWVHIPVAENYDKGPAYLTKNDIYSNYFVQAIPAKILIDKNGSIIERWGSGLGEPPISLEEKLEEMLGK